MATTRTATTRWEGSLLEGAGKVTMESSGLGTYDVLGADRVLLTTAALDALEGSRGGEAA